MEIVWISDFNVKSPMKGLSNQETIVHETLLMKLRWKIGNIESN